MIKKKYLAFYFLGFNIILGLLVFFYNDFLCKGGSCYELEVGIFEPMFFIILGLLPTLIFLVFFTDQIFLSWLKWIAWWFLLIVAILVKSNDHENDFSFFADDGVVVGIMMTILFIVTFVYVMVVNKKLQNSL